MSQQQWRVMSEELPAVDVPVLVYYKPYREFITATWDGRGWCVAGLGETMNLQAPTHWMPLPEPPQ